MFFSSIFVQDSKPSSITDNAALSIESDSLDQDNNKRNNEFLNRRRGSLDSDTAIVVDQNHKAAVEFQEFYNSSMLNEDSSMEQVMKYIIRKFKIQDASFEKVNNDNCFKISFVLESSSVRCDDVIHLLSEHSIGQDGVSSVAIVPCNLYHSHKNNDDEDRSDQSGGSTFIKETPFNRFIGTMRARLNVAKIVEAVKSDAALSFDFVILLIVAGILACFGLVENSTLFLAASMLISPLMTPILAATFGAVIKDHKLQFLGLRNELIGISLTMAVGFIFGLIWMCFAKGNAIVLTDEMMSRCNVHSLVVGIFIALPSGAAVAISVLGNNFGSLVGVAISASLLPPAVNTVSLNVSDPL